MLTYRIRSILRYLGEGVLLLSLTLPLSQCENHVSYPLDDISFRVPSSFIFLIAYLWPILTNFARITLESLKLKISVSILEALLCFGSAWLIFSVASLGGRVLYGAYVALAGLSIYLIASIAEVWSLWREFREKKAA